VTVSYRTCHLCEATCGLEIHHEGREITLVRGDRDDVFSHGYLCPKGTAIKHLESDPDRLRRPLVRRGSDWEEVAWDDAFAEVERGLGGVIERHGRDAVAVYLGNPNVHNLAGAIYGRVLLQALRTANVFTASTVDQMPKQVSVGLMFGTGLSVPIPDVDRTHHLLVLGANPFESNGSLLTAPDLPGRIRAIRARGGRVVTVDPRRTKTAQESDEWIAVRPGTDALLLWGMVHVLFADGLVDLGAAAPHVAGVAEVERLARDFAPETVAPACGVDPGTIRRLARDLAAAPSAAVYGRIGTCLSEFGAQASWLVDVCNVLTGNLDRPGGVMFPKPATGSGNTAGTGGKGRGVRFGRRASRVRGLPERFGELPVVALAEEIETPGDGQVRALVTIAGNPVLSNPDSDRLDAALGKLDFMVSVDVYRNETTRRADVILPPESELARGHYDLAFSQLAIRNVANWSPPLVDLEPGELPEWEILLRLAAVAGGAPPTQESALALDDLTVATLAGQAVGREGSPLYGLDADDVVASLAPRRGPERILDLMLRGGPYGLTLADLEQHPHGLDLGPLEPRLPGVLRTPSGCVELAPAELVADVERLRATLGAERRDGLVLVGRRHLRSNNSWMHNVEVLVKGKERCTLEIHPDDARACGVAAGGAALVKSATGEVVATVEVTDAIAPGVVSIPHGWGHDFEGAALATASKRPGVNVNRLAGTASFDPLSGNAALNGIPVTIGPA
jgi:anaerobic selenocysteine-containing dehydrogenase